MESPIYSDTFHQVKQIQRAARSFIQRKRAWCKKVGRTTGTVARWRRRFLSWLNIDIQICMSIYIYTYNVVISYLIIYSLFIYLLIYLFIYLFIYVIDVIYFIYVFIHKYLGIHVCVWWLNMRANRSKTLEGSIWLDKRWQAYNKDDQRRVVRIATVPHYLRGNYHFVVLFSIAITSINVIQGKASNGCSFFKITFAKVPKLNTSPVTSFADCVPDIFRLRNSSDRRRSDPSKLIATGQASKLWIHVEVDGTMTSLGNLKNVSTPKMAEGNSFFGGCQPHMLWFVSFSMTVIIRDLGKNVEGSHHLSLPMAAEDEIWLYHTSRVIKLSGQTFGRLLQLFRKRVGSLDS